MKRIDSIYGGVTEKNLFPKSKGTVPLVNSPFARMWR